MQISTQPVETRGVILALLAVSFVFVFLVVLANLFYIKPVRKKHLTVSIFVFLSAFLDLSLLLEINEKSYFKKDLEINNITAFVNNIPFYFQYVFVFVLVAFSLTQIYSMYKYVKKEISPHTIKSAIENLPMGLAFYDEKGYLLLSNRIIHKLNVDLMKKDLQNGLELENDILNLQDDKCCVVKGEEPVFEFNGSIWRFIKSKVEIDNEAFTKIQAEDITEIYKLSNEIRQSNIKLLEEQKRLKNYIENINKYVAREETLRIKMMVHDDFGELIALTVRSYEKNSNQEDKKEIIKSWGNLNKKMNCLLTFDNMKELSVSNVIYFSKQLNCELKIIGEIPKDKVLHDIIVKAMRESLKNAVYHAKADEISVYIKEENNKTLVTIFNDLNKNIENITLGGGLTSLKEAVEKLGGEMDVFYRDGKFTLKIIL